MQGGNAGDALKFTESEKVTLEHGQNAEVLVFDLPSWSPRSAATWRGA